ncbi:hypothetical protein AAFC00_002425 [Neodothiora populina]|uniref:C2H2-type domain-containing protein n=1 Tax=Neodothiora populina TaxID=2781224 RepID=A0ABR3P7B9_9PEZI
MSLFGGDSRQTSDVPSSPGFPEEDSDFSIEEINPPTSPNSGRLESSIDGVSDYEPSLLGTQSVELPPAGITDLENGETEAEDDAISEPGSASGRVNKRWARAWRHYTEADRSVAASLGQLRANDLSAHLYNAHVLKARLRRPAGNVEASKASAMRKSKWIPKDEATGEKRWYPDARWTAWPLEPEAVPHADVMFGASGMDQALDAYSVKPIDVRRPEKPSKGLEEELYATFLRQAKEAWLQRQPRSTLRSDAELNNPVEREHRSRSRSMSRDPGRSRSVSVSRSSPVSSSPLSRVLSAPSSSPSPSPRQPTSSPGPGNSAAVGPVKSEEVKYDGDNDDDPEMITARPVFSADDDYSHKLLAPTVRQVMSRLDSLLLALHHQREGHYLRNRDAGDTSDDSVRSVVSSKSRAEKPKSRKRAFTPAPQDDSTKPSDEEEDQVMIGAAGPLDHSSSGSEDLNHHSQPAHTSPRKKTTSKTTAHSPSSPRYTRKLGLRDWSEVLGVAAMTGWDQSVIQRATKRCEALFGETMTFRTFPEYGPIREENEYVSTSEEDTQSQAGYFCPFPMCKRHALPYERAYRWRDHLKRSHKKKPEEIVAIEQEAQRKMARGHSTITGQIKRQNALDFNPMNWVPPDPLKCPHCETSSVYTRVGRLLDHLRRTHRYDPRIQAMPSTKRKQPSRHISVGSSVISGADSNDEDGSSVAGEENDEEMLGGVRLDGFLQPVLRRKGRGKDKEARLKKEKERRSKIERKAAKRKRALIEEEEERLSCPERS